MQDIHSIGGAGRFYTGTGGGAAGGGGGGGDRRLRPQQHFHHSHGGQHAQPPVLKCPRCDSANTKFCYYNNYNLSQPRHFCKSCRRYWTKGGVLRNVPVGGGCRKTKRSKHKANSSSTAASTAGTAAAAVSTRERKSPNSHSSSESSSLTATTNAVAGANATEAVSAPPSNASDQSTLPAPPPPAAMTTPTTTANLEVGSSSDCGLFSELGNFSNLMANTSSTATVVGRGCGGGASTMPFEFGSIGDLSICSFRLSNWNQQQSHEHQEMKVENGSGLMMDPKAQVDLTEMQPERSNGGGGFGSLGDWQQCGDQGLFDLTNTVDQAYWSQNQWNDQDNPSLYLP